jgi:hypothetical protein
MTIPSTKQQGGGLLTVIILLVLAGGVYFGMQYIPQYMEAGTVDSILESIEKEHKTSPTTKKIVESAIEKRLTVNNLQDLQKDFQVAEKNGKLIVTVHYERELNLIYEKKKVVFDRRLELPLKSEQ